jgi:hypothetical protein
MSKGNPLLSIVYVYLVAELRGFKPMAIAAGADFKASYGRRPAPLSLPYAAAKTWR